MWTATSITPTATSARIARPLRDSRISRSLQQIDEHRVRAEKCGHQREEIDEVAQVEDTAGDRGKMAEQARRRDAADQPFRRPALEDADDRRRSRRDQHEDERGA